ncbi:uncharacterized protein MONOS_17582 [Monocercomonoides exilis]|uniref:uncharacterized protein n=1 Tax=Monocercomonoides exilis TaxID=2049356 RepID=UPI003559568C|nr:hypothetical protein MONOS_17582 [Monocercomonoides exilis]
MNKMNILCRCKPKVEIGELSLTKKFEDMLNNLGKYTDNDQKLKIEEMNGLIDTMKLKELAIISEKETFDQQKMKSFLSTLLKVAKRKEEDEETQKEAEMALMTLSHQNEYQSIEQKLYLNEIKEIIQYHQQHNNLTQLSYQSAWQFLIERLPQGSKLAKTTVNELHFVREATRGLNELIEC